MPYKKKKLTLKKKECKVKEDRDMGYRDIYAMNW